jgi:hypothetical protein
MHSSFVMYHCQITWSPDGMLTSEDLEEERIEKARRKVFSIQTDKATAVDHLIAYMRCVEDTTV